MFCPPWCLSPTGPGLCHIPLPTSRPGHPGRREGAGKGLLGAGVRLGHRRLGPLASRSPGRLAAGSAERRPWRRGGFSETAGGPACSDPAPGSMVRGPGRTQPPSRPRSSAPQVRRGRETHGVRDAARGRGEASAGGQPSPPADDPGALAGLPTGSRAQVWHVLAVRAGGGAEGGAGRPGCREHVGQGRPQSEPARGPPGWLGRGCPPAPDRARAPGNLCALEPGKGRATVGTLPTGPEEGGGSLQRLPRALPAGCTSPLLQPLGPASSPPRALGPVWGTPGDARLHSASRGRVCARRGAGGQHGRGLTHAGARESKLGQLPGARPPFAQKKPPGLDCLGGDIVWQAGGLRVCRHPGSSLSQKPQSQPG